MSNRTGFERRLDSKCIYCEALLVHPTNRFCNQSCITAWTNKRRARGQAARFLDLIDKTDGCWLWRGSTRGDRNLGKLPYGKFWLSGRKQVSAHRYSWELHIGPVPPGMSVLHKCDVPKCVNPDHLFLGTQLENMRDRRSKGR